jgi:xanthine dehydrogenase accessory factor
MEPFDAINDYLMHGKQGALATIISRVGAAPRDAGAKVFIGDDGKIFGSTGGGCMEAEIWRHARSLIKSGAIKILHYSLSGAQVEDGGMICGGNVDILIEPVTGNHKEVYEEVLRCISESKQAFMVTSISGFSRSKSLILKSGEVIGDPVPIPSGETGKYFSEKKPSLTDGFLIEPVISSPKLFIYGAGHISQYISRAAKMVDFHVTVIDDRASFANRERFPEADEVIPEDFRTVLMKTGPCYNGYAVIVTRGHKHDALVLEEVLKKPLRYIGMIGSKRKVKIIYDNLEKKGFGRKLLKTVHAPIGIDIGAETPQEIAMSIVAELIKVRSRNA